MKILGVDPGFANFGWCVVNVSRHPTLGAVAVSPVKCGVFRTEKSAKRLKVLAPNDEFRRCKELFVSIRSLVEDEGVRMVCAEGMSSPRNAATVRMLGYTWGILASVCEQAQIPLAQVSPKQLKKKLCGRISATDAELHDEVRRQYPTYQALVDFIRATTKHEHAFDALAAVHACRDGEVFRAVCASLGGPS